MAIILNDGLEKYTLGQPGQSVVHKSHSQEPEKVENKEIIKLEGLTNLREFKEGAKIGKRSDGTDYTYRLNRDRFFYPKEWMAFYDKLWKKHKFMFDLLINTGARIKEAAHIKRGDCDLMNKRIILRVTKVKARKGEKNPRPRTIPISTQFNKKLSQHIHQNNLKNEDYLLDFTENSRSINPAGQPNKILKSALQRAGIKDYYMFSIHNIRKTLETWLMALNVDGLKITAHIGHSMSTAAAHYISPDVFSFHEKDQMRLIIGDLYSNKQ